MQAHLRPTRLSLPFHTSEIVPIAVCTPHVRCWFSVAGPSLGRLACKGDEDMSPWPGNGGLALGSFWRREEEVVGSSW